MLGAVILLLGWRWRVASQNSSAELPEQEKIVPAQPSASGPTSTAVRVELNTADTAALRTVKGIGPTYAQRIVRFREVYGGFVDPQQLISALGLKPDAFLRIEPQVYADTTTAAFAALRQAAKAKNEALQRYASKAPTASPKAAKPHFAAQKTSFPKPKSENRPTKAGQPAWEKRPAPQVVDINQADSAALDALPGIGPRTAAEIIKFRNSVFFIHSLDQVAELWCVRPENFEKMKPWLQIASDLSQQPHLHINTASVKELAAHRFIRFKEARQIVNYRAQHGNFTSQADLEKMLGIPNDFWPRLMPYLRF